MSLRHSNHQNSKNQTGENGKSSGKFRTNNHVHPSRGSGALTFRDVTCRDWVTCAVPRLTLMRKPSLLIVHGFGVASCVFRPLMRRLEHDLESVQLFRYPSVGLELTKIVERLSEHLRKSRPDAIVAHSLGCIATWLAAHDANWCGPIVCLAPPFKTLPLTRFIPPFFRWPFAPLLDHRTLMTDSSFRLPALTGCTIRTIAGRFDFIVPLSCTHHDDVADACVTMDTHNSMLFSSRIAQQCRDWLVNPEQSGEPSDAPRSRSRAF